MLLGRANVAFPSAFRIPHSTFDEACPTTEEHCAEFHEVHIVPLKLREALCALTLEKHHPTIGFDVG